MTIYLDTPLDSASTTTDHPSTIGLAGSNRPHGEVFRMRCFSHSLARSGLGTSPKRPVSVFLPPTYRLDGQRRFPVVYLLHDLHQSDEVWSRNPRIFENVQHILNWSMKGADLEEFIVVMPHALSQEDAHATPTLMDAWERFLVHDLVHWADSVLRTKADAAMRGIAGLGLGGYGAMKLAFKYPDRFGSVYGLSPVLSDWQHHASTLRRLAVLKQSGRLQGLKDVYSPQKYQYLQHLIAAVPKTSNADAATRPPFHEDDGHWLQDSAVIEAWQQQCLTRLLPEYLDRETGLPRCGMDVDPETDYRFVVQGCLRLQDRMQSYGVLRDPILWRSASGQHVWGDQGRMAKALFPFFSQAFRAA